MIALKNPSEGDLHFQKTTFRPSFLKDGQIDLKYLISQFQKIASKQISSLHMGEEFEEENSFFYVVLRYKGYFLDELKEEDYTLVTYPVKASALTMYRYAYLLDKENHCVFYLISLWVLMDRTTRKIKPTKVFSQKLKQMLTDIEDVPPISEEKLCNFPIEENTFSFKKDYIVKKEDIDSNGHMNNTVYFKIAQDLFDELKFSAFELDYEKECFLDEKLSLFLDEKEKVVIGKKEEELSFKVKFFS